MTPMCVCLPHMQRTYMYIPRVGTVLTEHVGNDVCEQLTDVQIFERDVEWLLSRCVCVCVCVCKCKCELHFLFMHVYTHTHILNCYQ
jgi:hypothetical protein